ncbi:hypothetical protein DSO57_1036870 [Entomophthora muscae]|uniref:Uncharacterized protein n=1 Tax=Entomophthora muscae TaxID=34485 RepID=A0ACC2SNI6_9FUNG|nr:hypothetical protein DSO57_1036870 [Entomophthora muscae]
MMNTGKPKVKNPQYILHEKSEKENFVLKPYVRKRHHISYQPIKISRKVLEYNPFPIYGPEGVILPPSMEKDSEKLQGKQVKSVKEKLEECKSYKISFLAFLRLSCNTCFKWPIKSACKQ